MKLIITGIIWITLSVFLHWLLLYLNWYSDLPSINIKSGARSTHIGVFFCLLLGASIVGLWEVVKHDYINKQCEKCGSSRKVTYKSTLLSSAEKERLYKEKPDLFAKININLPLSLESNVTENRAICVKCNHLRNLRLSTDAHLVRNLK
jgi:hypothetical protein